VDIGKRIRDRRVELSLSVEEIAIRLNKNRTTIYRYEKGDIENLPLETLKPLADILETTPAYLMGWEDQAGDDVEESEPDRITLLFEMFTKESFTCEEYDNIFEYARFLVFRRTLK
jgi:transcriptional regulator with XRE-family HTH domain